MTLAGMLFVLSEEDKGTWRRSDELCIVWAVEEDTKD